MKRLFVMTCLATFVVGCGDTTPTKPISGSGASTPSTTKGAPIPKDVKPKMD